MVKAKETLKIILVIIIITFSIVYIGFNIWFSAGYPENFDNPYFFSGDETFISEPINDKFSLGFSKEIITPKDIAETKYYMGGYFTFPATFATEVLDDLYVRAICIDDNSGRGAVAMAVIDAIGLSNNDVNSIRKMLYDYAIENNIKSINIMTTHLHSGIDTIGLWGPLPKTGRKPHFMENLFVKTVKAIEDAYSNMVNGEIYYAETQAEDMFLDHRNPIVIDESIVRIRFKPDNDRLKETYIINLASHPEALMHGNTIITADFPAYMGQVIESYGHDFIFFNGAIGGLINSAQVPSYYEGMSDIEELMEYGKMLGNIVMSIDNERKIESILNIKSKQISLPLENTLLRFAGKVGVINNVVIKEKGGKHYNIVSEISYLELGKDIIIVFIPGELFPELAIGGILDKNESYNKTEFSYPIISDMVGENDRLVILGLANDAIGYIIPDNDYAVPTLLPYIRTIDGHYEETVSLGRNTASLIMDYLEELINSIKS